MGVRTPSYQAGFYAPERGGRAAYPQLWRGCVGAMNSGLGPSGLVLRDWGSRKNHGVLTNGPVWSTSTGQQAISLDGVNDYIQAPSSPAPSSFSILMHITINPGASGIELAGNYSSGTARGWGLWVNASTMLDFFIYGASGSIDLSAGSFNRGVRVCLAVVFSFAGNTCTRQQYINGRLISTNTAAVGSISAASAFTQIGTYNSAASLLLSGSVHEFLEYNRALSTDEMKLLAQRPGIAYELAPRRFISLPSPSFSAAWALRQSIIIGGGLQ